MSKNSEKKIVHNAYVPGRFDQAITLIFFFQVCYGWRQKLTYTKHFQIFWKFRWQQGSKPL